MLHRAGTRCPGTSIGPCTRQAGKTVPQVFDKNALTFICSSWIFDWGVAAFGDRAPSAFDHGALVPIVSNVVPRSGGDGVNVYWSGSQDAVEEYARILLAA